jgi:hypothetical protein
VDTCLRAPARFGMMQPGCTDTDGGRMDAGGQGLPPGTPRRRLGNFRTAELARRVRVVLAEAGIPSSDQADPDRPELVGRLLDRLLRLTGAGGNRVWVARARFREAVRALNQARRASATQQTAGTEHPAGGTGRGTDRDGGGHDPPEPPDGLDRGG